MIVIADTSPLNYLIQAQCEYVLPRLYRGVLVPTGVIEELSSPKAPAIVRLWISTPPDWLEVRSITAPTKQELNHLGRGEREAIELAEEYPESLLLIDERKGRAEAVRRGLYTTGTLGVLLDAGEAGLVDARQAYQRLLAETTFRSSPGLEEQFFRRIQ